MIKAEQDYALRAIVGLAASGRRMSSLEIACATNTSRQYLVEIFQRLRSAGLLDACRGQHGGYALARDPQDISVLDVFDALQEPQSWRPEAWPCAHVADRARAAFEAITIDSLAKAVQ